MLGFWCLTFCFGCSVVLVFGALAVCFLVLVSVWDLASGGLGCVGFGFDCALIV